MFSIVFNLVAVIGWSLFAAYGEPTHITWMAIGFHGGAVFFTTVNELAYRR